MVREQVIRSGYLEMLPAGAVLTGGGAQLPGTLELAEKMLGMPVRLGLPRNVGGLQDTVQSPVYTTAVGLILYAAKHHPDLRTQEKRRRSIWNIIGDVVRKTVG